MKLGLIVKELEALRMLKHQSIVNYKAGYLWQKTLWIVMEYLDGRCMVWFIIMKLKIADLKLNLWLQVVLLFSKLVNVHCLGQVFTLKAVHMYYRLVWLTEKK